MGKKRFKAEQIIRMLREADVEVAKGQSIAHVCRKLGIPEQTYYKWRKEYGGMKVDQAKRLKELEVENSRLKKLVADLTLDKDILKEAASKKLLSPAKRRILIKRIQERFSHVSQRRACKILGQSRSTQRYESHVRDDEPLLTKRIIELARAYGRYGYPRITGLLQMEGWRVGSNRVARIWRQEGLKVPVKQPNRKRLWFNDGSCLRLRPLKPNHVWSYDFVADRTHDGRAIRLLPIIDEFTRECFVKPARKVAKHKNIRIISFQLATTPALYSTFILTLFIRVK